MGAIFDKTAYEWDTVVTSFEVDMFRRLKLSALMKLHQEIGEMHLKEFGTDSNYLRDRRNVAFIFTKVAIKVHRQPLMEEKIRVRTWCSSLKGVRFTRNYVVFSENGELLTEAKGEVTTLNLQSRKIVRPRDVEEFADFLYNDQLDNSCEYPQKIEPLKACDRKQLRPISFSDIDYNGHVNNTVYADMVLDCLPADVLSRPIKGFEINYVNEVKPDETLEIGLSCDKDVWCFSGCVSDRVCFTVKLTF